jgi:signal transduction histidine kinase
MQTTLALGNMRYGNFLFRISCCLAVSAVMVNVAYFDLIADVELSARNLLLSGESSLYGYVADTTEAAFVLIMCLLPAIPRIRRPIVMILSGIGCSFIYAWVVLIAFFFRDIIPPITAPLIGLLMSVAALETTAWSEDKSERDRLENLEQMRQQLTDMLVHDLKKRTSSFLTTFSLLEKKLEGAGFGGVELLQIIRASGERLHILISNLLDIRKFEEDGMRLNIESLSLKNMIEDSIAEHKPACNMAGMDIRLACREDIRILADRQIFSRILTNLFWNALQHSPQGSAIEIACGRGDGSYAGFHVANRGAPIPSAELDFLFQPFKVTHNNTHSVRTDSTGLGLAFCKLAIEAHKGSIQLESPWKEHGDGVCVLVRFPADSAMQTRNAP